MNGDPTLVGIDRHRGDILVSVGRARAGSLLTLLERFEWFLLKPSVACQLDRNRLPDRQADRRVGHTGRPYGRTTDATQTVARRRRESHSLQARTAIGRRLPSPRFGYKRRMDTDDIVSAVDHDTEMARQITPTQEVEAIHQLGEHLHDEFPTVPAETVDQVVETHYHDLDDSPIRDYIPVLVERAAKDDLRAIGQ